VTSIGTKVQFSPGLVCVRWCASRRVTRGSHASRRASTSDSPSWALARTRSVSSGVGVVNGHFGTRESVAYAAGFRWFTSHFTPDPTLCEARNTYSAPSGGRVRSYRITGAQHLGVVRAANRTLSRPVSSGYMFRARFPRNMYPGTSRGIPTRTTGRTVPTGPRS